MKNTISSRRPMRGLPRLIRSRLEPSARTGISSLRGGRARFASTCSDMLLLVCHRFVGFRHTLIVRGWVFVWSRYSTPVQVFFGIKVICVLDGALDVCFVFPLIGHIELYRSKFCPSSYLLGICFSQTFFGKTLLLLFVDHKTFEDCVFFVRGTRSCLI